MFPIMIGIFSQSSDSIIPTGTLLSVLENDIIYIFRFLNKISSTLDDNVTFITNVNNYSSAVRYQNPVAFYELNENIETDPMRDSMGFYDGTYGPLVTVQRPPLLISNTTSSRTLAHDNGHLFTNSNIPPLDVFTIEFWTELTSYPFLIKNICGRAALELTTTSSFKCYYFTADFYVGILYFRVYANNGTTTLTVESNITDVRETAHIVITYDNTIGELKLYIDNLLKDTSNWTPATYSIAPSYGPIMFGGGYKLSQEEDSNAHTSINFDEIAIYNYTLSDTQISEHYSLGKGHTFILDSTLDNDISYIQGKAPLIGILNSTLDNDIVFIINNTATINSILDNDDANLTNISGTEYSLLIQSLNPIYYYELDETSTSDPVTDTMGNYDGTYSSGNTMLQTSLVSTGNNSILMDGTITGGFETPSTVPQLGDFTVEFWIKPNVSGYSMIIGRADTNTNTTFYVAITSNTAVFRIYEQNSTNSTTISISNAIYNGTIYHFVCTYNNTTKLMELYIDGVEKDTGILGDIISTQFGPITIGKVNYAGELNYPTNGTIDEVAIYDYVLSAAEILANYNKGVE